MLPTSRLLLRPIGGLRQTSIISCIVLDPEQNKIRLASGNYLRRYESSQTASKPRAIGFQEADRSWHKDVQSPGLITLPNILSMSRIALSPLASYLIINGMHSQAITCVGAVAMTDVASKIALKLAKKSEISRASYTLESIADFAFVTTCTITLFNLDMIRVWLFKGLMLRQCVVLLGYLTLRYFSFSQDKVTMREYLDFENRPTIGLEPSISSKLFHSLFYVCMIAELVSDPTAANRLYNGWALWSMEALTLMTACQSVAHHMSRWLVTPAFWSRLSRK